MAGIIDCSVSFRKWQKLMAARTRNVVRSVETELTVSAVEDTLALPCDLLDGSIQDALHLIDVGLQTVESGLLILELD